MKDCRYTLESNPFEASIERYTEEFNPQNVINNTFCNVHGFGCGPLLYKRLYPATRIINAVKYRTIGYRQWSGVKRDYKTDEQVLVPCRAETELLDIKFVEEGKY